MTPAAFFAAASAKRARAEWRVKRVGVGPHAHQEMLKESPETGPTSNWGT
jgi:hypothetical protein